MCFGKMQEIGPRDEIPVESKLERTRNEDRSRNEGRVMSQDDDPQCCERQISIWED